MDSSIPPREDQKHNGPEHKLPDAGGRKRRRKPTELAAWIARTQAAVMSETEFEELRRILAPVSDNYLRKLLRASGVPLAPLVEGVRQGTLDELEMSLGKLADEYESGFDPRRRQAIRNVVIEAKSHARWAAKAPGKRAEKLEMILWLTTWLENPPLFRDWVRLRRMSGRGANRETPQQDE